MGPDTFFSAVYGLMGGAFIGALAFGRQMRALHERLRVVETHCGIELPAPPPPALLTRLWLRIRGKSLQDQIDRGDFDQHN